jgi:hypothetical protein
LKFVVIRWDADAIRASPQTRNLMANGSRFVRIVLLTAFSLLALLGSAAPSFATGNIVKSDLKGTWQITLRGETGCGAVGMRASITFGTAGSGTGPVEIHGQCGDSTLAGQTFNVATLGKTGEGTATLTCGAGCLWHFEIQVAPDRATFNLANASPLDPGIFLEGTAVLASTADHIAMADMKGVWQVSMFGVLVGSCSGVPGVWPVTSVITLTLDATGAGTTDGTSHTGCGDFTESGSPFTILTLNADGSGTASGGVIQFSFQVSPDRSMFNLVTLSPAGTRFVAGAGIRRSTAGNITKTNLAGPWQLALGGADHDGDCSVSAVTSFKLNAKAEAKSMTVVFHGECGGDGTDTETYTLSVQTLNPDGSGTAKLVCAGTDCDLDLKIQVSPDRSTFSVVDVSKEGEFFMGTAIHQ